ncbi:phosphatase PAP2 family protein [Candidatus Woesearchaeota archaeon]|nr:phosphatase PAP2 family protein [Candidatus Woesearchaeota archaeon]
MKKLNCLLILVAGILIFALAGIDSLAASMFKNAQDPALDFILNIATNFAFLFFVMFIIPTLILYMKKSKAFYLPLVAFLASFVLAFIIKLLVLRQRPVGDITYPLIHMIDYSFPSMHSMVAFALLPVLNRHIPKAWLFWTGFAFLIAFTRIYFSFHFLSDIFFGALFGYFIGDHLLEMHEKGRL